MRPAGMEAGFFGLVEHRGCGPSDDAALISHRGGGRQAMQPRCARGSAPPSRAFIEAEAGQGLLPLPLFRCFLAHRGPDIG